MLLTGFGCSKADDAKPNPDLKVPEIKSERGPNGVALPGKG